MAKLKHEIWVEEVDGMTLHTCCYAGPLGDDCRRTLASDAQLLTTFEASSHFEAMTLYNRYLGREAYTTPFEQDFLYPEEWHQMQRNKNT